MTKLRQVITVFITMLLLQWPIGQSGCPVTRGERVQAFTQELISLLVWDKGVVLNKEVTERL